MFNTKFSRQQNMSLDNTINIDRAQQRMYKNPNYGVASIYGQNDFHCSSSYGPQLVTRNPENPLYYQSRTTWVGGPNRHKRFVAQSYQCGQRQSHTFHQYPEPMNLPCMEGDMQHICCQQPDQGCFINNIYTPKGWRGRRNRRMNWRPQPNYYGNDACYNNFRESGFPELEFEDGFQNNTGMLRRASSRDSLATNFSGTSCNSKHSSSTKGLKRRRRILDAQSWSTASCFKSPLTPELQEKVKCIQELSQNHDDINNNVACCKPTPVASKIACHDRFKDYYHL